MKMTKITKATSKGQITIPQEWRRQFETNNYILEMDSQKLIIRPVKIEDIKEEIIFDADRDNFGEGISADEMIRLLKESRNG